MRDQAQSLRELAQAAGRPARRARVVTVTSGKGGVGKTNLSVNLGIALVRQGLRVALIDADLGLANVDILLGIDPPYTLADLLAERRSVEDVLVSGPGGLKILAGGSGVYELASLDSRQLDRFVQALDRLDAAFDVLLIDTGAGVGGHVLRFVSASQEVIVVTTTEPSSLADAYVVIKAMSAQQTEARVFVAVNMAPGRREGEATFRRLETVAQRFLGVQPEFLGVVPRDNAVYDAVHRQVPFVIDNPHMPASRAIDAMARRLAGTDEPVARGLGGLLQRLFRFGQ